MYYVWTEDTIRLALLLLILLLLLASILAFFPLFELHLLHLLLLLLLYSLCAFWQCCLMLMSAIECGASVIFFYIYFRNLFCLLPAFDYFRVPLPVIASTDFLLSVCCRVQRFRIRIRTRFRWQILSLCLAHSLTPLLLLLLSLSVACSAFKIQFGNRIWLLRVCCCSASSSVCLPFCVYIEIISSIYAHLFIDGSHSFAGLCLFDSPLGRRK